MEIKLGKLLGSGAGSDVYEYETDKVCKLYISKYGIDSVKWEYEKTMDAYKNDLPVPKVYEIIEYNGRFGLIMERVWGNTFNEVLLGHIQSCVNKGKSTHEMIQSSYEIYVKQVKDTAKVLFELHQRKCKLKDTAKATLKRHCEYNTQLNKEEKAIILGIIENLPDSVSVCHGDPNPNNLLYNNDEIKIIDWVNCVNGHPLYDITEYKLMTEYSDDPNPTELLGDLVNFHVENKSHYVKLFLDEYVRLSNMDLSGMEIWIIPMLVSKMIGNNSEEKQQRLLNGIRSGLRQL